MTLPNISKKEAKSLYAELNERLSRVRSHLDDVARFADENGLEFTFQVGQYIPHSQYIVEEYQYSDDQELVRENTGDSEDGAMGWVSSFC